jgi:anaerobic magnesium-protoporphyrin IX monomethyl ester cyclase
MSLFPALAIRTDSSYHATVLIKKGSPLSEVLLLHPAEHGKTFGNMPPLGMAWITSFLRSKQIPASLVDLQVADVAVESLMQAHTPRIVGIGGTSHTRFESFALARRVKSCDPTTLVVYGGSHASFTAEDTLRHIPDIDIIVRGEGERTFYEITEHVLRGSRNFDDVPGLSYRQNGTIVHQPDVERIQNLDVLPFPYRDPQAIQRYDLHLEFLNVPAASVITSRGCPINCSFCSASAMFGTELTLRSVSNVADEIEMLLHDYHYGGIKFFDSTLTLKRSHVEALCAEIRRRRLTFPWECEIRVNGMSRELLRTMRDAGCYYVDFGVESASPRVLRTMHKGITLEQAENVLKWTNELGIFTKVFFTFGHIGETLDDARATVEFMERNARYISVAATGIGIRIYPGTAVEHFAHSMNYLGKDFSWTAQFIDQNIESLGNDPIVPILLQPQFGWREFRRIEFRLVRFWLKNPGAAIKVLWNHIKLGRARLLVRLVHRFVKMHIFKSHRRLTSEIPS